MTSTGMSSDKPKIPLISTHVINDEDMSMLESAKLQALNLSRVVKLLTDPHSAMLYDRHVHALRKVIRHYQKGFLMKELVQVFKILNVCSDRVETQSIYEQPLIDVLKICALPYLQEKSSDEILYEQIVVESISQLGYLMRVPSNDVRKQICSTLSSFYSTTHTYQISQKHKPCTMAYNQRMVENSDISETLINSLALMENDLEVKHLVLSVLQEFSKNSEKNCAQMLRAEGARRVCSRLIDDDPSGEILFRSVDILWNLVEHGDRQMISDQLNNIQCVSQLRDAFIMQLTQGYSHYDRQLRNDLLVVATMIATNCTRPPFIETGFSKQLTLFATFQEVKSHNALVKHLKLTTNHEDFELKKLLFNILNVLSKDRAIIPILSEGHLMLALFSYVHGNEKTPGPRDWTNAQFEEIQLLAMSCLISLCPIMLEDYMTCQGSTRLLLLLEWCVGPDKFAGHGNGFHGIGGRGNKRAQLRHCLKLMRSVVSTDNEMVLQDMADQGAIDQLIGILDAAFGPGKSSQDDLIGIEMQFDILVILSSLCDGDIHRKELFGNKGIDIVISYLKTDSKLLNSGLGHHRLLLASIDCAWCAIVGCNITEDYFLEREGVFLMIDLLNSCPKNFHNIILGCLLDLCENPKTVSHILTWRGKSNISAPHLFCELWRLEEREIGVHRDESGAITDLLRPLMGEMQAELGVITLPAKWPSQSIVDVSENMRAKIYSIFCKVGYSDLPGLLVKDHVTLTVVEKYMDLKVGEVRSEVISELEMENVRPVTPDLEALQAISRAVEERVQIVSSTQEELLDAQKNQDILDEQEFYAEIRENHRQKEKAMTDFSDFVSRTSNYTLLQAAKERQELSIDASRVRGVYRDQDTFHHTEIPKLQTTTFCGRHIVVDTTPMHLSKQELTTFDLEPQPNVILLQKHVTV